MTLKLGVNLDHVATIRQARGTNYPHITEAAEAAILGGADGLTVHLREDRRHIQTEDVVALSDYLNTQAKESGITLNLEMAATKEMLEIACKIKPNYCCLVPEKREELTTEGGLNVVDNISMLRDFCDLLAQKAIQVSLFIDPDRASVDAAATVGVPIIELNTGEYANLTEAADCHQALHRIDQITQYAQSKGIIVNAGHGLTLANARGIANVSGLNELNIGHSIVARSIFVGLRKAVSEMKQLIAP